MALRAEDPDAAALIAAPEPPEPLEPGDNLFFRAWEALRFDRPYGSMGGEGRITFQAIDAYALRRNIAGETFDLLVLGVRALDAVWLEHVSEQMSKREKPS